MATRKEKALSAFEDILSDYFWYNRDECDELNRSDIDDLVDTEELTSKDLTNVLDQFLLKNYGKSNVVLTDD